MGGLIQRVVGPFSLLGLLSIAGCGVAPFSGDSKTAAWHRQLEFWLERGLAHPVDLGPFQGIGPAGIGFGPTRVGPSGLDSSTMAAQQVWLLPDLLKSWQQRELVLQIGLSNYQVHLNRNREGSYWVFPRGRGKAPRLRLQLKLLNTARLALDRGGQWSASQGQLDLDLPNRKLDLHAHLWPGIRPISNKQSFAPLRLKLRNHWGEGGNLQLQLALQQLPLKPINAFLPSFAREKVHGSSSGLLLLNRRNGRWQCWGPLGLERFSFQLGDPLQAKNLKLVCKGEELVLAPAPWQWAAWRGDLAGNLRWNQPSKLRFALAGHLESSSAIPKLKLLAALEGSGSKWRLQRFSAVAPTKPAGYSLLSGRGGLDAGRWWLSSPSITWASTFRGNLKASGRGFGHGSLKSLGGNFAFAVPRLKDPLRGSYSWRAGRLEVLANGPFRINGYWQPKKGMPLAKGAVAGLISLDRFNLQKLSPNQQFAGFLNATAELSGSLQKPVLQGKLLLQNPAYGPLQLPGEWSGKWQQNNFWLRSGSGLITGNWRAGALQNLSWQQGPGELRLVAAAAGYRWWAQQWPLEPLRWQLRGRKPLLFGGFLTGSGNLERAPFSLAGSAIWQRPAIALWRGKSIVLSGKLRSPGYAIKANLDSGDGAEVSLIAKGAIAGQLDLQARGRRLQPKAIWNLWQSFSQPLNKFGQGKAVDLLGLDIATLGENLDGQLLLLRQAEAQVAAARSVDSGNGRTSPEALRGLMDADISLRGPNTRQLNLSAAARGQIWLEAQNFDKPLQLQPFVVSIQGQGSGDFSFSGLPIGLIALLTPVPSGLRGALSGRGKWSSGKADQGIQVELALEQGMLRNQALRLERGRIELKNKLLDLDLALRGGAASSSIDLSGRLPLNPTQEGMELRLSSRNDGLIFLAALLKSTMEWREGSADLQLLVRGSRQKPIANGFIRLREAEIKVAGQTLNKLQAALFFDFKRLVIEEFSASVGSGNIEAKGSLPLINISDQSDPKGVKIGFNNVPIQQQNLRLRSDGELLLTGTLLKPELGGELALSNGRLQLGATQLAGANGKKIPLEQRLPEIKWQFQQPLVLLGPTVESSSGVALRQAIPAFGILKLKDLRLTLGPDLRITAPPVADFSLAGLVSLNGILGPDIQLSGVVRLLQGRINVFTSSLRLDNNSPNVAVFTPSLGLIPYLDLALTTRVSDQVRSGERAGPQSGDQLQGSYSNLDRLNLVKVLVKVQGPADRIGDNLELRSFPPLPRERLIALLGGNSLAGLAGGDAGTALVTVLGQTLLTPVVGGFSELLGQRLNVALYPAFLDPYVANSTSSTSSNRRVPSKLVLGSEVGLDITDRINLSVLAAPNRSDIPPEATLRFQATDNLGLQGSFDQQGRWQSQVQLFFRF